MMDSMFIKAVIWASLGILVTLVVVSIWSLFIYITSRTWHRAKDEVKEESFMKMTKEILKEKEKDSAKDKR